MENLAVRFAAVSGVLALLVSFGAVTQGVPAPSQHAQVYSTMYDTSTYTTSGTLTNTVLTNTTTTQTTATVSTDSSTSASADTTTSTVTESINTVQTATDPAPTYYTYPAGTTAIPSATTDTTTAMVRCPFNAQTNRTIVDYTRAGTAPFSEFFIKAQGTREDASVMLPVTLPSGKYEVRLASYDAHRTGMVSESSERWKMRVMDPSGRLLDETPASRDIADSETLAIELVDRDFTITGVTAKAIGIHAAYQSDVGHGFGAVCAAFDRVGEVETTSAITTETPPTTEGTDSITGISTYRACPIPAREGRIIADFTKGGTRILSDLVLRADDSTNYSSKPIAVSIPVGTYAVRLAAYGGQTTRAASDADGWRAHLMGGAGTVVARTPALANVPEWETEFVTKVSDTFSVPAPVSSMTAVHASYPTQEPAFVAVLCAAFDRVDSAAVSGETKPAAITSDTSSVVTTADPPAVRTLTNVPLVPPQGTVVTSTTVKIDDDRDTDTDGREEPVVVATPESLGVPSALREIVVPGDVQETRSQWMRELPEPPFSLLARVGLTERTILIEGLMRGATSSLASTTDDVDAPTRLVRERTSREDAPERDGVVDTDLVKRYTERDGLVAMRDTDGDGVSDYDEENFYGTNPDDPFTSGSVLTDGERLLLGLDPQQRTLEPVVVESPRVYGIEQPEDFTIDEIALVSVPPPPPQDAASTSVEALGATTTALHVRGTTRPYAFVTVYIYSTPVIVTVRADETGHFEYTFDSELPDGSHELYVATTNNAGNIVAKSTPVPFVKTAQAIEYLPSLVPDAPADPVDRSLHYMITFGVLALLLLAVGGMVWLGRHTNDEHDVSATPAV